MNILSAYGITIFPMKRFLNLTEEQKEVLQNLLRSERYTKVYKRLQFLELKSQGKKNSEILPVLYISHHTCSDWMTLFLSEGFEGLCHLRYEGRRKWKLSQQKEKIQEHMETTLVSSLNELKDWIEKHLSISVQTSWLWEWCKKNWITLIRRPKDFLEDTNQE